MHDITSVKIYQGKANLGRMSDSTITLIDDNDRLAYTAQIGDADDIEMFDIDVSNFVSLDGGWTILCLAHLCCMVSCSSLYIFIYSSLDDSLLLSC